MLNELGLKGNSLIIYATIYGFSQTNDCEFTGSANYLAEWCGCSRQTVMTTLNKLVKDNLIIKHEEFKNNVKFCSYGVNLTGCKNSLQGGVKKFDRGVSKNLTGGCQNSLHNNIDKNNRNKTIDKNNTKKDFSKLVIGTCLKNDIEDDTSIQVIEDFLQDMKIKTKKGIEANIAKVAGQNNSIIQKVIDLAYARNYRYIPDPSWLKESSKNRLPQELRLGGTTTDEARSRYKEALEKNDPKLHHF